MIQIKSSGKYIKTIRVHNIRSGEGTDRVVSLVIQKTLSSSKTHLEQPIWSESWRSDRKGRLWAGQLALRGRGWAEVEGSKLVSVLILTQSSPLTRLTQGLGGVTRCLESHAGSKALAMRASPQFRLPDFKIQTLFQGTYSNTAGSLSLMALHAAQV